LISFQLFVVDLSEPLLGIFLLAGMVITSENPFLAVVKQTLEIRLKMICI
jgi:hypothetical protein